jgi:hypothetical protein
MFARACHEAEPELKAPAEFYAALMECQKEAAFGDSGSLVHWVGDAFPVLNAHLAGKAVPSQLNGAWERLQATYADLKRWCGR